MQAVKNQYLPPGRNAKSIRHASLGLRRCAADAFLRFYMKMKKFLCRFTLFEKMLWSLSVFAITLSFLLFDRGTPLTLIASLLGVTSLLFAAKGNPLGPALMILFSLLYGAISLSFSYYGEMMTYLGMTLPMSVFALAAWLKNPYQKGHAEVKVARLCRADAVFMLLSCLAVTLAFGFLLARLGTANLIPSTVSVATSYLAAYLTYKRSPYYALAYAANDVVLILLWVLASFSDVSYLSVTVCFVAFLAGDLYGFLSWLRMQKAQAK